MSSDCLGTRDAKRKARKECYLAGRSRKPYSHTPVLSLRGTQIGVSTSAGEGPSLSPERREKIRVKCSPVLSRYVDIFNGLVLQGSALKSVST